MSAAAKTRETVEVGSQQLEKTEQLVAQVVFGVTGVATVAIGGWAVACMIGGLVSAGGPLSFVFSWFRAVSGI
jgi:hypothetical protein